MFTRLLKMLSGLVPLCLRKRIHAPRVRAGDIERILADPPAGREALAPDCVDEPPPPRADYRVCDTCDAFLSGMGSTSFTCRRCADARGLRFGQRPARASAAVGGVLLSLPIGRHVPPGGQSPRTLVRLGAGQAETLARILLKPGSAYAVVEPDGDDSMLMSGWRRRDGGHVAEITVCRVGLYDKTLILSAVQAARLGEEVAGCLGIIFTDARNEHVAGCEVRLRCGAIRAGNRD